MDERHPLDRNRTVPGIGPGRWDSGKLARDQERKALTDRVVNQPTVRPTVQSILFSLYTEDKVSGRKDVHVDPMRQIVVDATARYFAGATFTFGLVGLWQGQTERTVRIDIIGLRSDLQRIFDLAGDIRVTNGQSCVLVTWTSVSRFDITEESINDSAAAL